MSWFDDSYPPDSSILLKTGDRQLRHDEVIANYEVDRPTQMLYSGKDSITSMFSYLDSLTSANYHQHSPKQRDHQMFNQIVAELQSVASQESVSSDASTTEQRTSRIPRSGCEEKRARQTTVYNSSHKPSTKYLCHDRRSPFTPTKITKRAHQSEWQKLIKGHDRRHYTMFYSPGDDGSSVGSYSLFEYIGRRRPEELSRPYVCPEGECTMKYQWWRSLQHHILAKHNLIRKKVDYPEFANLTT